MQPEGSKNSMLEVVGSFAGAEVRRRSRWHECVAGHFEWDVMEPGGASSKLWMVADGQRV
jgi:hypothetical protein